LEDFSTDGICFNGQTAPLSVVERWTIWAQQLMKCAVFFHEKVNDPILLLS
jgi:hypothetical protein